MKKYILIFVLLFSFAGVAKQSDKIKDVVVVNEKPFIATPTNKAIYEDCKKTIELYENKDPKYVETMCYANIQGAMSASYFYGSYQQIKNPESFDKCGLNFLKEKIKDKKTKNMIKNRLYSNVTVFAEAIIRSYEEKVISDSSLANKLSGGEFFGGAMAMFYQEITNCKEMRDINPLKDSKSIKSFEIK